MAFLKGWATGSHETTSRKDDSAGNAVLDMNGIQSNVIPTAEPTGAGYVKEKASQYGTTFRQNKGGNDTNDGIRWNPWNLLKMLKYRKILKREGKYVIS